MLMYITFYSQICPNGHLPLTAICLLCQSLFLILGNTFPIKTICPKRPNVLNGHLLLVLWVTAYGRFDCIRLPNV
jgi:hypothetical protein